MLMKKTGLLLFLAAFVFLAFLPFVGMLLFGPADAAANEILADAPKLENKDGSFNRQVLNDASDYVSDRFWLRQELITLNAKLESTLFRESASKDVVLGKDGWLYFSETLDDYQGQNQMTDRQIWSAARCLYLVSEYAASKGARTLFVVAPNKNSVYPEYMPDSCLEWTGERNRDRLYAELDKQGVEALDLLPALTEEKDKHQIYQTWDSHWNNLGAALAHDRIAACLGKSDVFYQPDEFTAIRDHAADLYTMLYPAGTAMDEQLYPNRAQSFSYTRPIRSPEDQTIRTTSENATGSLLMFRDSFGNTLHTFMAESWATACFSRAMPYQLSMLETEAADTLVLEIVERNLIWLAQRAPILPAPVRDLDVSNLKTAEPIAVSQEEASGMTKISGTIPDRVDTDSPG